MRPLSAKILLLHFFWLSLFMPVVSLCQGTGDVDASFKSHQENMAPIMVDGQVLFYVRGVMSYPAEMRAATIRHRIYKAADNYSNAPDSVRAILSEDRLKIYADKEFIMNVYEADAEADGITKELHAEVAVEKIKGAIKLYRQERRPLVLKSNIYKAGAAMLIMIVCLAIFIWIFRRLNETFKARIKNKIDRLENVSFKLIQSGQLLKVLHVAYKLLRTILILIIIVGFLGYILSLFPWTRNTSYHIRDLIVNPIRVFIDGFVDYLPSLVFLIIIIIATQYLVKLIRVFFHGIEEGGIVINGFDPEWSMPTFKIAKFLIIVFAAVVAFPYIPGSSTGAFQGISVFLGVLFSLGSSSFVSNVIAGYSMTYRRAFKKGDRIRVNEHTGFVEEQSLMVTRLRSIKNEEIIIPNSVMLNSSVFNYSHMPAGKGIVLHTSVGIGYETPWRQVYAMLMEAANRTEGLVKDPPPFMFTKELGDFAVVYEINAYCFDVINMYKIYTLLHQNILDVFNENNVQIMTPAYEGDPETPKVVPREEWNKPLSSWDKNSGATKNS